MPYRRQPPNGTARKGKRGFTLVEILVATSITLAMLLLFFQVLSSSTDQWKRTNDHAKSFASARLAFDTIIRTLSLATLHPSYDYFNAAYQPRSASSDVEAFIPEYYGRTSNLHFISGHNLIREQKLHAIFFQAPFNFTADPMVVDPASGQLNSVGFFLRYDSDRAWLPPLIANLAQPRMRLYSFLQPANQNQVFQFQANNRWFTDALNTGVGTAPPLTTAPLPNTRILADNIVVFVIVPDASRVDRTMDNGYEYDSRTSWNSGEQPETMHQLPHTVRVLMVAVDEASATRYPSIGLANGLGPNGANTNFSTLFKDPGNYSADLETVREELSKLNVNYRVFQTDVQIRASRWSQ